MSLIWVYFLRSFFKSILSYDTNLYDKVFAMLDIILVVSSAHCILLNGFHYDLVIMKIYYSMDFSMTL